MQFFCGVGRSCLFRLLTWCAFHSTSYRILSGSIPRGSQWDPTFLGPSFFRKRISIQVESPGSASNFDSSITSSPSSFLWVSMTFFQRSSTKIFNRKRNVQKDRKNVTRVNTNSSNQKLLGDRQQSRFKSLKTSKHQAKRCSFQLIFHQPSSGTQHDALLS